MDIRKATLADTVPISNFVSDLSTKQIASELGEGGIETLLASMDYSSTGERLKNGWLHLLAMTSNRIAGIVVVKPPTHLYHLFVRTDLQRSGVGRLLLAAAYEHTLIAAASKLMTVNSLPNAVGAYRRFGFETAGDIFDDGGVRHQPVVRRVWQQRDHPLTLSMRQSMSSLACRVKCVTLNV
jgi:GNAT superfamily N-acetyltransferase